MATAASILASNPAARYAFVLEIEGYDIAFTTVNDTAGIAAVWSTWTNFIAGLEKPGGVSRTLRMLMPKFEAAHLDLSIIDVDGSTVVSLFADADTSANVTTLTADVDRNDTTLHVVSTASFPASGTIYVGRERITYSGKTATTFTGCTRGTFPFGGKSSWGHTHKLGLADLGLQVRDKPAIWRGRGVNLYLTAIDPSTETWTSKANSLLWFAGYIRDGGRSGDGVWSLACESVERAARRPLLYEQFVGHIQDGFDVYGEDVTIAIFEQRTGSGVYYNDTEISITAGHYTLEDYLETVNTALAAAKSGGSLADLWSLSIAPSTPETRVVRCTVYDSTAVTTGDRFTMRLKPTVRMARILGTTGELLGVFNQSGAATGKTMTIDAPLAPYKVYLNAFQNSFVVEDERGSWAIQPTDEISQHTPNADGYIQFGDNPELWGCTYDSGTKTFTRTGAIHRNDVHAGVDPQIPGVRLGEDRDLTVKQVYWTKSMAVSDILLRMLLSTGTSVYNDATYDVLDEQMGIGIPSTLVDLASFQAIDGMAPASLIVDEPTPAEDLIDSYMGVFGFYIAWKDGALTVLRPNTVGGSTADYTLDNDVLLAPVDMDFGTDTIANVATLKFNRMPGVEANENYVNIPSQQEHGESNALEYEAPWLYIRNGRFDPWRENVIGPFLAYFGRAIRNYSARCSAAMLGVAPGHIVEWTDDSAPDAETGAYGLTTAKAWVVGAAYDPRGEEVTLTLLRPTGRHFAAPPSLMLDYSRGDKGYDSGGPYLYVRANEFSYSSEEDDITHLTAGDKIRIVEADPADPAAPDTWVRTANAVAPATQQITLDSTLSSPAFDTAKRYYVEFDDYSTVQTSQQDGAYIADDADDLIQDAVPPTLWASLSPSVESGTPVATNRFRRPYNIAYAEGEPMSPHKLRDLGRNANVLFAHVTNQHPISRQYATERTTANTDYTVLASPFVIPCPAGVVSLELSLFVYVTSGVGTPEANFRVTSTPTPPTGPVTAAEFSLDLEQVTWNVLDTSAAKKTGTLQLRMNGERKTYITVEAQAVVGTARIAGISARFSDRAVA